MYFAQDFLGWSPPWTSPRAAFCAPCIVIERRWPGWCASSRSLFSYELELIAERFRENDHVRVRQPDILVCDDREPFPQITSVGFGELQRPIHRGVFTAAADLFFGVQTRPRTTSNRFSFLVSSCFARLLGWLFRVDGFVDWNIRSPVVFAEDFGGLFCLNCLPASRFRRSSGAASRLKFHGNSFFSFSVCKRRESKRPGLGVA